MIPAAEVQVRIYGHLLSVDSPAAEQIAIYSTGGQLLYRVQKPAGRLRTSGTVCHAAC
jgi:hypothetical protein